MPRVTRKRLTSGGASSLGSVQIGGNPRQKNECWRTEMRHPTRQKKRGIGHVAWIETAIGKEIAGVVERHHDHDQAAQDIDRIEARARARNGRSRGRHPRGESCRQCVLPRCIECYSHDKLSVNRISGRGAHMTHCGRSLKTSRHHNIGAGDHGCVRETAAAQKRTIIRTFSRSMRNRHSCNSLSDATASNFSDRFHHRHR